MNIDIIHEFGDEIYLMSDMELQFLREVENALISDVGYDTSDSKAVSLKDSLIGTEMANRRWINWMVKMKNAKEIDATDADTKAIIDNLNSVKARREKFLQEYPKWAAARADRIKKLKELSVQVELVTLRTNYLRALGNCTFFLGGSVVLASYLIKPFNWSMSNRLSVCGGALAFAGLLAKILTGITEKEKLTYKLKQIQEIIKEAQISSLRMGILLYPVDDLGKDSFELTKNINEFKDVKVIIESVKILVDGGMKIKNDSERLDYIKRALEDIKGLIFADTMQRISKNTVAKVIYFLVLVVLFGKEKYFLSIMHL